MEKEILKEVDNIANDMIKSIIEVVKIDSVESGEERDAPFGKGVKLALDKTLDIAKGLGFNTYNLDNYIGYASYGESEEYIAAIGHLDVVKPLKGWREPPFSGYTKDGVIYSRGILDNKGPILSCLYGLYALKRLNIKLNREVRIIFGCDEESGFLDLEHYLKKEKPPIFGFTPDCKYPVVYAERGRLEVEVFKDEGTIEDFFEFVNEYVLNSKSNGERFNLEISDEEFGALEVRNFKLNYGLVPSCRFSVSYPASTDKDEILKRIEGAIFPFKVVLKKNYDPVKFNKDCFLVETLKKTYEMVTLNDGTPVTTTGGTYAKLMKNIVPFGPSFPGQKGIGHQPNEWMKIEDIITNAKIYALSLYYLGKG